MQQNDQQEPVTSPDSQSNVAFAWWEWGGVVTAIACFLVLGFSHLGAPSLWHDELVHVYVAKGILDTGQPVLPGGAVYTNYLAYNTLLAGWMALFGDSEAAVRSLSVLIGAAGLAFAFGFGRAIIGRVPALVMVAVLTVSPWYLAWARQGRFYILQLALYLVFLALIWRASRVSAFRRTASYSLAALGAYMAAVLASFHSILFVTTPGLMALHDLMRDKDARLRHFLIGLLWMATGLLTLIAFKYLLSAIDQSVIFTFVGFDKMDSDAARADTWYYFRWLALNHSTGFFVLAMAGFLLMAIKERRRGLFWVAAFWAPILVLNFYVGYKRPRFMFFLFPLVAGALSYALVHALRFLQGRCCVARLVVKEQHPPSLRGSLSDRGNLTRAPHHPLTRLSLARRVALFGGRRTAWLHTAFALLLVVFLARCAVSTVRLFHDSLVVAGGSDLTLAKLHPRWRESCNYVRRHLAENDAILASSFLPVHHYAGRCDNWYPSRFIPSETQESGMAGLRTLDELKEWLSAHPQGHYIADTWQFDRLKTWPQFETEYAWVAAHMEYVPEASSESVSVWRWTPATLNR